MLNSFRAFSGSFMMKALLGFLVLSFALWGVGDVLRSHNSVGAVATVGGQEITREAFGRDLHREMERLRNSLGKNYSPELVAGLNLPGRVLQANVQQKLLKLESDHVGLIPSDAQILQRITENRAFFGQNGKFDKARFQSLLRNSGSAEKDYVERLRDEVASAQLVELFSLQPPQMPIATQTLYKARGETRNATLYTLTPALVSANLAPDETQAQEYYKAHEPRFTVPEARTVSYVTISEKDMPAQNAKEGDDAFNGFLNTIDDTLASGSTLSEVAAQYKLKVVQVGTITREGKLANGSAASVPAYDKFIETAFKTDEKSESQLMPIKGGGFYILHVEEVVPEHLRPLAEVKQQVVSGWQNQQRSKELAKLAETIEKQFATPEGRKTAIARYNLSGTSSGQIKRKAQSSLPSELVEHIFMTAPGKATPAEANNAGNYVIAVVDSVTQAGAANEEALRTTRRALADEYRNELLEEYMIHLEHKYPVKVNEGVFNNMTRQQ